MLEILINFYQIQVAHLYCKRQMPPLVGDADTGCDIYFKERGGGGFKALSQSELARCVFNQSEASTSVTIVKL